MALLFRTATAKRSRISSVLLASMVTASLGACTTTVERSATVADAPEATHVAPASIDRLRKAAEQHCMQPGDDTLSSVIRVATKSGSEASGVVIAQDRILTAAHVVRDEPLAFVYVNREYRVARVVARDMANDLALLVADTGQLRPIRISNGHLFTAEPVWTVGFPLALEQTANFGRYQQHVNGAIHSSAGTNAGASGGGLLRCEHGNFQLAGMIRGYGAYWDSGELRRIEDLSISVPADTISDFAMSAGVGL